MQFQNKTSLLFRSLYSHSNLFELVLCASAGTTVAAAKYSESSATYQLVYVTETIPASKSYSFDYCTIFFRLSACKGVWCRFHTLSAISAPIYYCQWQNFCNLLDCRCMDLYSEGQCFFDLFVIFDWYVNIGCLRGSVVWVCVRLSVLKSPR